MNPEKKQGRETSPTRQEQIQTPPPPQVIDPSKPPGQGAHETYRKGEAEEKKARRPR
ncbi:MAG TPA: hypothetical protein VK658_23120 [Chryseolinea sp.]|nr:hypothetical protein [Chryseolinea sp.]